MPTKKWRKNSLFNERCWDNWISPCKKSELQPKPYTEMDLNWLKDLNVKPRNIELLQENI